MDVLFICKEASAPSLVTNILWAMEARKAGRDVAVLFSAAALTVIDGGTFLWPTELAQQDTRWTIADKAKEQGLPLMLRGQARQLDFRGVLAMAKESGLAMYADPFWTDLLALRGKIPTNIKELSQAGVIELLDSVKKIVGSL